MQITNTPQEARELMARHGLRAVAVTHVEHTGVKPVFDVSLLTDDVPVPKSIVTNGIVTHNSTEVVYTESIMKAQGIKIPVEEVFGIRDPQTNRYVVKPRIRLYFENVAERFFDYLAKLERILPDKVKIGDNYYFVYPHTKENISALKGEYDTGFLRQHNKLRVPAPNGLPQAFIVVDSYPAMLPEGQDVDDPSAAMAVQARMFSDQMKRVKGKMRAKRITVVGMNQLRERPATMYGCYHALTKVMMADGSTHFIRDVVKNQMPGPVMAYNPETNGFEPRAIVDWYENGDAPAWIRLTYAVPSFKNGARHNSIVVTPYQYLWSGTHRTLLHANDFEVGDSFVAYSDHGLSYYAKQILLGSMLGDGYFVHDKGAVSVRISHKTTHKEMLEWKAEFLPKGSVYSSRTSGMTVYETKLQDPWLTQTSIEHNAGCFGHDKNIPDALPYEIDPLGLAVWYMDDACKSKDLVKMQAYPLAQVKLFCKVINKRFGTACQVSQWKDVGSKTGRGYGLVLCDKFMRIVAPYVHKRFKSIVRQTRLNAKRSVPRWVKRFGSAPLMPPQSSTQGVLSEIVAIETLAPDSHQQAGMDGRNHHSKDATRYDIQVQDLGLFVANGVVGKNSPQYEPCGQAVRFYCMAADTLLFTSEGIIQADACDATHRVFGKEYPERPNLFGKIADKRVITVSTEHGYSVRVARSHQFWATWATVGREGWYSAERVAYGDYKLQVVGGQDLWGTTVLDTSLAFAMGANHRLTREQAALKFGIPETRAEELGFSRSGSNRDLFALMATMAKDVVLAFLRGLFSAAERPTFVLERQRHYVRMMLLNLGVHTSVNGLRDKDAQGRYGLTVARQDLDVLDHGKVVRRSWWEAVDSDYTVEHAQAEPVYDGNMPTSHIVTDGIMSHNSDCRLQVTARSNINGKGMLDVETSVDGQGEDKYRYIHVRAVKNKLSTPYLEGMMRLWISDRDGRARGFDPFFDTSEYLKVTGQIVGKRNSMRFHGIPQLEGARAFKWEELKAMIVGTKESKFKAQQKVGIDKPLDIRGFCRKQLADGDGFAKFFETMKTTKKEGDE